MWLFCVLCYYKRERSSQGSFAQPDESEHGRTLLCALIVDVHFILACCVVVGTSVRKTPV